MALSVATLEAYREARSGELEVKNTYGRWQDSPFVRWNNSLAEMFFKPERAGKQVWLAANPDLLDDIASREGLSRRKWLDVLFDGPPWNPAYEELCRNALNANDVWRARGFPYPPYLHYLCLFSAAGVTGEGAFRVNAYYPRLWALLGHRNRRGMPNQFDRMIELWLDLERWAHRDMRGSLGLFTATAIGQHRHIGLPLAQNLLTPAERSALPAAFSLAGLRAGRPELEALAQAVTDAPEPALSRVQQMLAATSAEQDRAMLLELLMEAYDRWAEVHRSPRGSAAGSKVTAGEKREGRVTSTHALRLAVRLDRVAGTAQAGVRAHINPFPAVALRLRDDAGRSFTGDEQSAGWSSLLVDEDTGHWMNACVLGDWKSRHRMEDADLGLQFELPPASLRVLQPGERYGLPHLVEVHELEIGRPAHLLVHVTCWSRIRTWAGQGSGLRPLETDGLLPGWHLAEIDATPPPEPLRDLLRWLPAPGQARLTPVGGLRVHEARNTYFHFAPPALELRGGQGNESVKLGVEALTADLDGRYQLPGDLLAGVAHTVRAERPDGSVAARLSVQLDSPVAARAEAEAPRSSISQGAEDWPGQRDLMLVSDIAQEHQQARLLGARAQVVLLDRCGHTMLLDGDRSLPPSFRPVWAVPMRDGAEPSYCGHGDPGQELPAPAETAEPFWFAVLRDESAATNMREPRHAVLAELWRAYLDVAR